MQSFVYLHRKKSKDAIFGDQVDERWDQHDQSITFGNADYKMREQLRHAD
jgi:hypothetical protein